MDQFLYQEMNLNNKLMCLSRKQTNRLVKKQQNTSDNVSVHGIML